MSEKTGLVLEGGGMRGAYTAGALTWLIDNGIDFDYGAGISSGAVLLYAFAEKRKDTMYRIVIDYMADPAIVGVRALLNEGYYVAYRKMFHKYLRNVEQFTVQPVKDGHMNIEVGAYDLEQGETVWFTPDDMDDDLEILRGTCSLPIAAEIVDVNGRRLLDGGITKMIPIERSVEQGVTRHLVITTKPEGYVRKKGPKIINDMMKVIYKDYPQVAADYAVRHINYYKQIQLIEELEGKGQAMMIRPSRTVAVNRWKGEPDKLKELYELGIRDMEDRKEEIIRFLKGE